MLFPGKYNGSRGEKVVRLVWIAWGEAQQKLDLMYLYTRIGKEQVDFWGDILSCLMFFWKKVRF